MEVGIPATLISYLTPKVGFAAAGLIAGRYWILMLIGRFVGSTIGGKVSSRTMVICVATVAIAPMVAAMLIGDSIMAKTIVQGSVIEVPLASTLLVLCGLCTSVMWTSIFNMATEGLGKYTAKARPVSSFCREEVTRTPDPYVPNVVRYQLRYFSTLFASIICWRKFSRFFESGCKSTAFF